MAQDGPGLLARLTGAGGTVTRMSCDGPDCPATGTSSGRLHRGRWSGSGGWRHEDGQDFCPICQRNGNMELAVRIGHREHRTDERLHTSKPRI